MGPINKKSNGMKTKNKKKSNAQKKQSSHNVRGVSPAEAGECVVGKICERGRF